MWWIFDLHERDATITYRAPLRVGNAVTTFILHFPHSYWAFPIHTELSPFILSFPYSYWAFPIHTELSLFILSFSHSYWAYPIHTELYNSTVGDLDHISRSWQHHISKLRTDLWPPFDWHLFSQISSSTQLCCYDALSVKTMGTCSRNTELIIHRLDSFSRLCTVVANCFKIALSHDEGCFFFLW